MPVENQTLAKLSKEKGDIAFKDKDYAIARSLYSHGMAFDQSNYLLLLNRCMVNLKLKRWDEAEADATKTLNLCQLNSKAFFRRGRARKELRKWDQARVDIQLSIENGGDPEDCAQELKAITDAESSPPSESLSSVSSGLESELANLHLQDDSDSSLFSIYTSTTPQKGKGAFASRDIRRGELILSESPMICISRTDVPDERWPDAIKAAVRKLSPAYLDSYLSLQNAHSNCSCPLDPLMGIFCTNTFGGSGDDSGIYLKASRFNHSCSPNASFNFNSNMGELQIYALRAIPRGEEISISYISSRRSYGSSRRSRRDSLRNGYHFTCVCSICSLPRAESRRSDARRQRLNELWEIAGRLTLAQKDQIDNVVKEGIRLLLEEGRFMNAVDFWNEAGPIPSDWISMISNLLTQGIGRGIWGGQPAS